MTLIVPQTIYQVSVFYKITIFLVSIIKYYGYGVYVNASIISKLFIKDVCPNMLQNCLNHDFISQK